MKTKIVWLALVLVLCGCTQLKSTNDNALVYRNGKCRIFYPANNEELKEYAKSLCETGEKAVLDYIVEDYGEFKKIYYEGNDDFFVTEADYAPVHLEIKNNKEMLKDLLRYSMKVDDLDAAYTSHFLMDTRENDLSEVVVSLEDEDIDFYFPEYDYHLKTPFKYAQDIVGRDFGYEDEIFEPIYYINPNRPMVAVTYDDGPYRPVDTRLLELMDKYGARCTFYIVGNRLSQNELENIQSGIDLGMEYGSHSEDHSFLSRMDAQSAKQLVEEVVDFVYEKTGYTIRTYRPPYGARNYEMEEILDLPTIMWNNDSNDWANRNAEITYDNIMNQLDNYDVILMHSLYHSTADASERLIPDLMDMGYQLVTVSDLMEVLGVTDKYFKGQ